MLARLLVLTDQELILIRDDPRSKETRGVRYGGVWEYIPLQEMTSLSVNESGQEWLKLNIELASLGRVSFDFDRSRKPDLDRLIENFKQMEFSVK